MAISKIIFFPVNNGSMVLLKLNDSYKTTILFDMNITKSEDEDSPNNIDLLRNELKESDEGFPFVDVFVLSHNDSDHITGLSENFYLGEIDEYKLPENDDEPKIVINEIWGSSKFLKRESSSNKLCEDAKVFNKEMKRRVKLFESKKEIQKEGNRILILCKDSEGKTDNIMEIVKELDSSISVINNNNLSEVIDIVLLGPFPQQSGEEDEEYKKSNRASVILQLRVKEGNYENKILLPGDAEVFVWETLWDKWKNNTDYLEYNILECPHHCSWHSLSYDSISKTDNPKASDKAKKSLGGILDDGFIVSSSKAIKDDDIDPPSIKAKEEYLSIVDKSHFLCTGEYPEESNNEPIVFNLTSSGPQEKSPKSKSKVSLASSAASGQAFPHGL